MKLTGKCKEYFEDYVVNNVYEEGEYHYREDALNHYYSLKESMQQGVLIDFFDSVGINISLYKDYDGFHWCIGDRDNHDGDESKGWGFMEQSRPMQRTAAIEKANQIYNETKSIH